MLRGAAPDRGRAVRPTAAHVETMSATEPGWRARSPAGAADRTQRETRSRLGVLGAAQQTGCRGETWADPT